MEPVQIVIAAVAVLVGTVLQRVSGTGVGLVLAPVLTLLFGPLLGVMLTNLTTPITALLIMLSVRTLVEWRHAALIIATALPGVALGAWLTHVLPDGVLMLVVGVTVLLGLAVAVYAERLPGISRRVGIVPGGFFGGLFNAVAGIAAPALVVYSRMTRWDQAGFAATMQPVFLAIGLASVLAKVVGGASLGTPTELALILPGLVVLVVVGILLGSWLDRRVSKTTAARVAILLAGIGGVLTVARGLSALGG
ncbi:MAG: sulfite exporter TauE/SafE family protein [Propionibacteriaceae bacterium]|nr:sulfite exporter TauE/SafE family protein [Propionibacteriaceae bacterium]